MTVPDVGPLIAATVQTSVSDATNFATSQNFAAGMGLSRAHSQEAAGIASTRFGHWPAIFRRRPLAPNADLWRHCPGGAAGGLGSDPRQSAKGNDTEVAAFAGAAWPAQA